MKNTPIKFKPDALTGRLGEEDAKRYFSRFGWFAFAVFVVHLVVANAVVLGLYKFAPNVYELPLVRELLSFVPLYCIALPLTYPILRPLHTVRPSKEKMSFPHFLCSICICFALMTVGNYISNFFITFFQMLRGDQIENPLNESLGSSPLWSIILFTVVLAPLLEELFFRGIVCKKLLCLGEGYAVVLSSAFFALFHGNFYQLFYAFTLGCFFSFIYVKTGKLKYTVVLHMLINFMGGAVPSILLKYLDVEQLLEANVEYITQNIIPVALYVAYAFGIYVLTIGGIIVISTQFRKFRLDSGILPPPEKKRASCVLLNSGVAAAIAAFTLVLISSLTY